MNSSTCGSIDTFLLRQLSSGMWMCPVVQLATPRIGYVGVDLGRRHVGVAQHLLDGAQVGAALQQVRRERVAEEVGVHTIGVEARPLGEAAKDQERAGPGQRAAARVQEQLRPVAAVEGRPAA
jgi:hypothetical protein